MPLINISYAGNKFVSVKINRWTDNIKANLKKAMYDINTIMHRAITHKLRKPQIYEKVNIRRRATGKVSKVKQFVKHSPFNELRARTRRLMQSFAMGNSDSASKYETVDGLPALTFGTNVVYARVHEFGGAHIKKREYFLPTIKENRKKIAKRLHTALRFK